MNLARVVVVRSIRSVVGGCDDYGDLGVSCFLAGSPLFHRGSCVEKHPVPDLVVGRFV